MADETINILQMLQEGKISVEEATTLNPGKLQPSQPNRSQSHGRPARRNRFSRRRTQWRRLIRYQFTSTLTRQYPWCQPEYCETGLNDSPRGTAQSTPTELDRNGFLYNQKSVPI